MKVVTNRQVVFEGDFAECKDYLVKLSSYGEGGVTYSKLFSFREGNEKCFFVRVNPAHEAGEAMTEQLLLNDEHRTYFIV